MTEIPNYEKIYKENQDKSTLELLLKIRSSLSILRQRATKDTTLEQNYINKAYKYSCLADGLYARFNLMNTK